MTDTPHGMTREAIADALRAWDGLDDPDGPDAQNDRAAGIPQPSRPTPAWGAPSIGAWTWDDPAGRPAAWTAFREGER